MGGGLKNASLSEGVLAHLNPAHLPPEVEGGRAGPFAYCRFTKIEK
jgi:hypothetical protein